MQILEEEEDNKRIILASSSPRRKKILEQLHLDFEIIEPKESEERLFKNPYKTVLYNSLAKAKNIYNHAIINDLNYSNALIAGFDTIVYLDGRFFGFFNESFREKSSCYKQCFCSGF